MRCGIYPVIAPKIVKTSVALRCVYNCNIDYLALCIDVHNFIRFPGMLRIGLVIFNQ